MKLKETRKRLDEMMKELDERVKKGIPLDKDNFMVKLGILLGIRCPICKKDLGESYSPELEFDNQTYVVCSERCKGILKKKLNNPTTRHNFSPNILFHNLKDIS